MAPVRSIRRTLLGSAVLCGWTLGVLVLPALHLAFHAIPHDHIGGGIRYRFDAGNPESAVHTHPHPRVDAGALRRASGAALVAPVALGLTVRAAGEPHDARGLAHFGSAPGEGADPAEILPETRLWSPDRDVLSGRLAEFLLESKRAPRPPPAA